MNPSNGQKWQIPFSGANREALIQIILQEARR